MIKPLGRKYESHPLPWLTYVADDSIKAHIITPQIWANNKNPIPNGYWDPLPNVFVTLWPHRPYPPMGTMSYTPRTRPS